MVCAKESYDERRHSCEQTRHFLDAPLTSSDGNVLLWQSLVSPSSPFELWHPSLRHHLNIIRLVIFQYLPELEFVVFNLLSNNSMDF